jgi:hypothetical protein
MTENAGRVGRTCGVVGAEATDGATTPPGAVKPELAAAGSIRVVVGLPPTAVTAAGNQ